MKSTIAVLQSMSALELSLVACILAGMAYCLYSVFAAVRDARRGEQGGLQ